MQLQSSLLKHVQMNERKILGYSDMHSTWTSMSFYKVFAPSEMPTSKDPSEAQVHPVLQELPFQALSQSAQKGLMQH